jgi:EmrB/QacA subfamily drug resistance transporter
LTTAVSGRTPDASGFSHSEIVVILVGLMLGMFLAALDQTIVATALPSMAADLNGTSHLSWVVSAYLLTTTAATPIYGKLSDFYGRKIMLQIAIVLFLVASVLCALSGTMVELIGARALQGVGGGGLISMAHATIADVISPRERGRYQAYIASVWGAASIGGPVLGGLFVDYLDWRWVFWINLPIGFAALVVSEVALRRLQAKREPHRIDYLGAVLVVSATTCLLLVTTMGGNEFAWGSMPILGLAAATVLLAVLCVLQELRAPEPLIPPRLFGNRNFVLVNGYSLLATAAMIGAIVFLPLFLQLVYGLQASVAGLLLIPFTLSSVLATIVAGRLIARTGRYRIFPLIGLAMAAIGSALLALASGDTSLTVIMLDASIAGVGTGLIGPTVLVSIQNTIEPRDMGAGTASVNFCRALGGAFGAALFGAILLARLSQVLDQLPAYRGAAVNPAAALIRQGPAALTDTPAALHGAVLQALALAFSAMFWVATLVFLASLAISWFVDEEPLKTTPGLARAAGLQALGE